MAREENTQVKYNYLSPLSFLPSTFQSFCCSTVARSLSFLLPSSQIFSSPHSDHFSPPFSLSHHHFLHFLTPVSPLSPSCMLSFHFPTSASLLSIPPSFHVFLQAVTLLFYLLAFLVILQRVWAYIGCFICT